MELEDKIYQELDEAYSPEKVLEEEDQSAILLGGGWLPGRSWNSSLSLSFL